ncbi:uncharacterized protein [Scyliorhinus torazame]|uniref:uncharacterized protein n=1 Tax=Scyliorhinus torazame TaxID=75743 RepID=UPI003B58F0A9
MGELLASRKLADETLLSKREGENGVDMADTNHQEKNGNNSSSCVSHQRSEPYVYICKSLPTCEGAAICPIVLRDGVHLPAADGEWEDAEPHKLRNVTECRAEPGGLHQCQNSHSCQDDDEWVESSLPNGSDFCKCGILTQCALFPEAFNPYPQIPLQQNRQRKNCCLQRCNTCDADELETGPLTQTFPLCIKQGDCEVHKPDPVAQPYLLRELQNKERELQNKCRLKPPTLAQCPADILNSPHKMKGGCSIFGLGVSKGNKKEQSNCKKKGIEYCQNRCNRQRDDMYVRETDEMGTTCLSYKTPAICSGDDDLCKSCTRHSKREDQITHCQRSVKCGIDRRGGCVSNSGIEKGCVKAATNKNTCILQERPKVSKRCGARIPELVPFPREDTSWLSCTSRRRIKESSGSGKRLCPRNDSPCCNGSTSPGRRREMCRSSCLDHIIGRDTCRRQTDDVYVCEFDDIGTSCLYYKQCPKPCNPCSRTPSDDDGTCLCEGHKDSCKDGKLHSKDNAQPSDSKGCNLWQVADRTKCAKCSENTGNRCGLPRGEYHTLCDKGKGACSCMMCSLPQWPRQLLLQNSGAQATTTLYKV